MKTYSLSVVPMNVGCNAGCKFCISKSTFRANKKRSDLVSMRALYRACRYARDCGAITGIITGKGEPLMVGKDLLIMIADMMGDHFSQIDLHTNGILLADNCSEWWTPAKEGHQSLTWFDVFRENLTNLTISIGHYDEKKNCELMGVRKPYLRQMFDNIKKYGGGIHLRLSCVLAKGYIDSAEEIKKFCDFAKKNGASSVIFRELWVTGDKKPHEKWCKEHFVPLYIPYNFSIYRPKEDSPWEQFLARERPKEVLDLPWTKVYDYRGMTVNASECDFRQTDMVKSLILLPDNHLYHSWGTTASRLW